MSPVKALAIASLGLALVGGGSACADGNPRPNILIIVTDDQRDGLSAMPETTRLFRRQGVRLKLGYVTDPLCCPSRASIMTGRYPHNTGVRSDTPHPEYGVLGATALDSSTTIQRYLHDDGYTTALVGKYLNQWDFSDAPPFFDTFTMVHKQSDYFHNLVSSGELGQAPDVHLSETYNTTLILRRTLDFLHAHEDASQPFFLYVAPEAPHYPQACGIASFGCCGRFGASRGASGRIPACRFGRLRRQPDYPSTFRTYRLRTWAPV